MIKLQYGFRYVGYSIYLEVLRWRLEGIQANRLFESAVMYNYERIF